MFQYECLQARGEPVGHCVDSWLVGSCCKLPITKQQQVIKNSPSLNKTSTTIPISTTTRTPSTINQSVLTSTTTNKITYQTTKSTVTESPLMVTNTTKVDDKIISNVSNISLIEHNLTQNPLIKKNSSEIVLIENKSAVTNQPHSSALHEIQTNKNFSSNKNDSSVSSFTVR